MRMPGEDASALDWILFEQSGVLSSRQAVTELSPSKVRHLVRTGRWRRVCHGVLVTHTGPFTLDQQRWIAVLAAGDGALLAGLAAAQAGGLRGLRGRWPADVIDVVLPHQRAASGLLRRLPIGLPAVRVHRTRNLPDVDRQRGRPDRTSMPRSVIDAAQWARTDDEARVVLAAGRA
jgi:hypothetical protein